MITENPREFLAQVAGSRKPQSLKSTPSGVFMVRPAKFRVAEETVRDNRYMVPGPDVDSSKAARQFDDLVALVRRCGVPVKVFEGRRETPDDVFPNNVFGTAPGTVIVGRMRYPGRQLEANRADITAWLGRDHPNLIDLRGMNGTAELTGSLVIDRGRNIGFCGLSERADRTGAKAMHEAFGLELSLVFELAEGEYHTNVLMSVLAGRAVVLQAEAFSDPGIPECIERAFPGRTLLLTEDEKNNFAGNCIALTDSDLFMSQRAAENLGASSRSTLEEWGFTIRSVDLSEIEKAGGSLRCMVAEVF